MEPKDMTNNDLVKHHADARAFAENSDYDLAKRGALKVSEDCGIELFRRLNEADALREENAELRKDKARLDWLATNRVYFPIDHPEDGICVLVSENAAPSGSFGDMSTGDMAALRKVIDAARLAKESEASHDRPGEATND